MMKIQRMILSIISIFVLCTLAEVSQGVSQEKQKKQKKKGKTVPGGRYTLHEMVNAKTTEEILKVYTNHQNPAPWRVDLVAAAHDFFLASRTADYADLIEDPAFMKIVKSRDLDLLGGPMLGQISETGAAVWVRTVGPAEVSVAVNVNGTSRTFGPVKTRAKTARRRSVEPQLNKSQVRR